MRAPKTSASPTSTAASASAGASASSASMPAETAIERPSYAEQQSARQKQDVAEATWSPADAEWAEEAVEEDGEALFHSIFERTAVGIALVDLEGRIAKSNPALAEMLDLSVDELAGRAFTDMAHPEDAAVDQERYEELVAGESDHYTIEKRYVRPDGSFLWGQMTASLITDGEDLPRFVIGIIEDVSERHRAEEAVRQRDRGIREAYTQVIAAATGGRLVLMGPDEIDSELGEEVWRTDWVQSAEHVCRIRRELCTVLDDRFGDLCDMDDLALAAGEAMTNAIRYAGGVRVRLRERDGLPQIEVIDRGPGIDFAHLPEVALVPGYSTTTSLGMGFTLMLSLSERLLLVTSPAGTHVVLEGPRSEECVGPWSSGEGCEGI